MATIDTQIRSAAANISNNIDTLAHDRPLLAQNLLSQLRNLVEAVTVRLHLGEGDAEFVYEAVAPATAWIGSQSKQISFLGRFHKLLQMSASHYTLDGDASERLMLKYYEYLHRIRGLLQTRCGFDVLDNLERFPVDLDQSLREYHEKIAERIDANRQQPGSQGATNRYYLRSVRPFFTGGRILYEVIFSEPVDNTSKFDRIIAFTDIDMTDKYAANLTLVGDSINVLDQTMPITIIRDWEVSIRPCEFDNYAKIFGQSINVSTGSPEYRQLMRFLTDSAANLLDLMDMEEARYTQIRDATTRQVQKPLIFPVLDAARQIIREKRPGDNVLRYLMLQMNNRLIKTQLGERGLSNLYLPFGCKPFDDMPFCTSLLGHNPRFADLVEGLDASERKHEFLARRVKNNVERHGKLYTPLAELDDFGDVQKLISEYNSKVYYKHTGRTLIQDKGHVFLREYEDDTVAIIDKIQEYVGAGVDGYENAVARWLNETPLMIDDDVKKQALRKLFSHSCVALVYGAAGTGKSTMVNYIANYFGGNPKLFLTHTHPAKDNLERRVSAQNAEFRTISSHTRRQDQTEYDVLVIDECSTVSNSDLLKVLQNTSFKLLVLVGDVHQIESIRFGNWFSVIRSFVPNESVFELTTPFRTKSPALLDFWSKVRNLDDGIEESISRNGYSAVLDQSLFQAQRDDAIILCLNYDGLYGINNINRFLQSSNPNEAVVWGVANYKVGDPILFNEVNRYRPLIYNNLKGRIVDIVTYSDRIQFDIWLDRSVSSLDVERLDLEYVADSTVRFDVYKRRSSDGDDHLSITLVPFQVSYAVSIHKAQGLEYDSVKIVITDANEDDISHSIFYTAITRAREHLQIFWTPETQQAVLSRLERRSNPEDVALLKARRGVAPVK